MQNNKQSTTQDSFFKNARVRADHTRANEFKAELSKELTALYVDNISKGENPTSSMSIRTFLMSKPFLGLTAAVAVVIAAAAILFNQGGVQLTQPTDATLGAEIVYSEGTVEYKIDEGWYPVEGTVALSEGASVRTLGEARTIINLDDGSAIRLNYNSEITLSSLDPNDIDVALGGGSVYTRVAKLDREFEVVTENARYLSLGTAYKTTTRTDFESVSVYESKVQVDDGEDKKVIEQGKAYNLKAKKEENVDLLYPLTNDQINKDSFALWNRDYDVQHVENDDELGVFKDLINPDLAVTSHQNKQEVTSEKITIKGTAEAGAKVLVNGNETPNNNGSFAKEVTLKVGENTINVKAIDDAGNYTMKTLVIIRKQENVATQPPSSNNGGSTSGSISISAHQVSNGVKISWTVSNLDVSQGYKVLKSTSPNPTYPSNNLYYIGDSSARNTVVPVTDGKSYYFRICRYNGSGCDSYSNTVQVTAPDNTPVSTVNSISLSSAGGGSVTWNYTGTVNNGFKVLWSKSNSAPSYPPGGGVQAYYTDGTSKTVNAFDGAGTYYVRICEYLDGTCGTYSNTITVDL